MFDALAVYLPEDRRQASVRHENLPERTHGAALFVDISGFTLLTDELVRHHGPQRGAEELTAHLERVYDILVQQIYQYRGSVIGYSGDAAICWFDGDDGLRAIASAFGMQNAMKKLDAISFSSGQAILLAVKVAIVVGNARRLLVGDPSIQLMDVLTGSVVERLAVAAQVVHSGEVVVDSKSVRQLEGKVRTGDQRRLSESSESLTLVTDLLTTVPPAPWPDLPPDSFTEEQVRSWILPALYARMSQGQGQFLTELRPTVALFLRFGGINYENDPTAGVQLDAFIRWVQTVLTRYEGVLLQVMLDEKGSYLYATFGAPVVHEDDARRAVSAALELRTLPKSLSFIQSVSIGLSRGTMRTGPSGSATRRAYSVLGDEVNVASRLMEAAAPGEIIISERVMQRVTGHFETLALPQLKVKGKSQPVPVYRVVGEINQSRQTKLVQGSRLVGRAAERAQLNDMLSALAEGKSNVVVVEGEAGIGKSSLVVDWLNDVASYGVKSLVGATDAIERSTLYHAWKPIFSQLFQWDALPSDSETRREHVLNQLEALGMAARAPLLNVVLPLELPDNYLTAEMSGKVRADNTHEVLLALLQKAASEKPLLIVIEDAHWLDSASWALVSAVMRQVQPLLFVLVSRPLSSFEHLEYQAMLEQPGVQRLQIRSLQPEDAIRIACQRLGVNVLPEEVSTLILEKAEGHPFFSEELAYALRDSGVLQIVDGQVHVAPGIDLSALNLPGTVHGIVTSRIDLLAPGQQLALKVASVIGRVFDFKVLEDVHPVEADRPKLAGYLEHLEKLDVTLLASPPPDLSYMFKHVITQQAAYNLLLYAQRHQLHQAVAEWYERVFAKDLSQVYPLLAHHWLSAHESTPTDLSMSKAIEYLEKAGDAALRNYANREAVGYFEKLLTMVNPQNAQSLGVSELRMAHWEHHLGEAHNRLGHLTECEQHFSNSMAYLGFPLPATGGRLGLEIIGQLARQTYTRVRGPVKADHPKLTDDALEARRLACQIYERLSLLYFIKSKMGLTIYCPFASLNLAEEIGPSPELAIAYSYVTSAAGLIPAHGLARLYERLTLQTADQINSPLIEARVLMAAGVYGSGVGRLDETEERLRRAIASFEEGGVWEWWGVCMEMLTRVKYYQGQFRSSAELADRLYALAKRQDDLVQQSWSLTSRMETHLLLADHEDVLMLAAELEGLVAKTNETGPRQKFYGVSALVHLQRGEWSAADESAKQLLKIISSERPTSFGLLTGYIAAAETYLNLWERRALPDLQYLKQQATLACKLLARYAQVLPIGEPAKLRAQGLLAWLSGNHKRAGRVWHQGLIRAQELRMPLEEALMNYELGRHLPSNDSARNTHLGRAQQLLQQLGVRYYEPQVRNALKGILSGS